MERIGTKPNNMPELPEVETVKNVLLSIIKGRTITKIDVLRKNIIISDIDAFVSKLTNKTFLNVSRIGKYLIFHLSDDVTLISHLRMEGKYFELDENENNTKYSRVVFHLDNGHKLCYDDSRCFGIMKLSTESAYKKEKEIKQLGKEPFDIDDVNYLIKKVNKSNNPIKSTLLDQTLMTGLGNIYADEVLFASKIHPLTPAKDINKKEWETIVSNARRILNEAIKAGGSTIRSYHPGKNIDGNFQVSLKAYGKGNTQCPECGHIFRFMKVNGRGTTYCPYCQIKKGDSVKVAITGKIASGKSSVLKVFKDNNIKVISADEIVKNIYENPTRCQDINSLLGISNSKIIDKALIRDIISKDIKQKKKLEKYIHPLVQKEMEQFLKINKGILVCEVPLLFESKMENMFDVIIGVDINKEIQLKRLMLRNPDSNKQLAIINQNNTFDENKKKADFIIDNSHSLQMLEKEVNKIINKLQDRLD